MNINIGLGTLLALLAMGIVLGAFFAGKLEINIPEELVEDIKMYGALMASAFTLLLSLYYLYRRGLGWAEAWALSYLIFTVVVTLAMTAGMIPNPTVSRLRGRFFDASIEMKASHMLWLSASLNLLLAGVRE